LVEIIGVRFKPIGKIYYFSPKNEKMEKGDQVIVETSRGVELTEVVLGNHMVEDDAVVQPLRPVVRKATPEDLRRIENNAKKVPEAMAICRRKILLHKLDMKLINAEYTCDGSKILFYFSADGRVDFRELVKDLAAVFHMRIELRQIGVRDEAKLCGGLGICGRPFCCNSFLDDFQPVSIKMAKEQNLSLNPTKISGTCGRLMCCLKYEEDAYEYLQKTTPRLDSYVQTPMGSGTVVEVSLLKGQLKVKLDKSPEAPKTFHKSECTVIREGKRRAATEDGAPQA